MAGRPWNNPQREELKRLYEAGTNCKDLADKMKRSSAAIVHQLRKLRLINYRDDGWYKQGKLWISHRDLWQLRIDEGDTNA